MHAHFLYESEHTTHALMRCRWTARRSTNKDCYRPECIHKLVNVNERNMNLNRRTTIDRERKKLIKLLCRNNVDICCVSPLSNRARRETEKDEVCACSHYSWMESKRRPFGSAERIFPGKCMVVCECELPNLLFFQFFFGRDWRVRSKDTFSETSKIRCWSNSCAEDDSKRKRTKRCMNFVCNTSRKFHVCVLRCATCDTFNGVLFYCAAIARLPQFHLFTRVSCRTLTTQYTFGVNSIKSQFRDNEINHMDSCLVRVCDRRRCAMRQDSCVRSLFM